MPPMLIEAHRGSINLVTVGLDFKLSAVYIAVGKVATELQVANAVENTGILFLSIFHGFCLLATITKINCHNA